MGLGFRVYRWLRVWVYRGLGLSVSGLCGFLVFIYDLRFQGFEVFRVWASEFVVYAVFRADGFLAFPNQRGRDDEVSARRF